MTLQEVADQLDLNISTISRAVNGKYLQTDFGTFELRTFFVHGLKTAQSGNDAEIISSDTAKQLLQQIVDEEDKRKPLSDQKIEIEMKQKGIPISRRTVAKYRQALNIPTSSKRKRFE